MLRQRSRGQTFIEYTLMIGILVTILIATAPLIRRGIQGMVRVAADQVGVQKDADQPGGRQGRLINSLTWTDAAQNILKTERLGETGKEYSQDQTFTRSQVYLNQGFSPTNR